METQEGALSYEEARKQRLEENKKRMQELGLANLSKSLTSSFTPAKTPNSRQAKPRAMKQTFMFELRRSSRVASNPQPDYREVEIDISAGRRSYSRSCLFTRKYASDEARMEAANKAETIMKELSSSTASFVKPMLQSHVTGGFWLGLPSMFCKSHLPKRDDKIVLEDENGHEWETVYLANKAGLSGGWRGFSLDHGLVDGDALVFELVEPRRFKVHIVRAYEGGVMDEEEKRVEGMEQKADTEAPIGLKRKLEAEGGTKTGKKKQKTESRVEKGEDEKNELTKELQASRGGKGARCDEIDELFEIKEDRKKEGQDQQQITSLLRAKKPAATRPAKKSMVKPVDAIPVC